MVAMESRRRIDTEDTKKVTLKVSEWTVSPTHPVVDGQLS